MTDKINLGVIGLGIAFRDLHLPVLAMMSDQISIRAVCSRHAAGRQAAVELVKATTGTLPRSYDDVGDILNDDLDAILICVPIHVTASVVQQTCEAGLNIICEKPLGESAAQAAGLVEAAESAGLVLGVCENFRYQEAFDRTRRLAESGVIGEVRGYYLNDLHYTPPTGMYAVTEWRTRGSHRGGYILDGGSHIIAGLRAMVGETPTEVSASGLSFHPDHLGGPWDTVFANLVFASGKRGHLTLGYGSPDKEARHPKLLGTEGTIAVFKDRLEVWQVAGEADQVIPLASTSSGILEEWQDFIPALADHKPLRFSAWESVQDLAVFDAIMESCDVGSPIPVSHYAPNPV